MPASSTTRRPLSRSGPLAGPFARSARSLGHSHRSLTTCSPLWPWCQRPTPHTGRVPFTPSSPGSHPAVAAAWPMGQRRAVDRIDRTRPPDLPAARPDPRADPSAHRDPVAGRPAGHRRADRLVGSAAARPDVAVAGAPRPGAVRRAGATRGSGAPARTPRSGSAGWRCPSSSASRPTCSGTASPTATATSRSTGRCWTGPSTATRSSTCCSSGARSSAWPSSRRTWWSSGAGAAGWPPLRQRLQPPRAHRHLRAAAALRRHCGRPARDRPDRAPDRAQRAAPLRDPTGLALAAPAGCRRRCPADPALGVGADPRPGEGGPAVPIPDPDPDPDPGRSPTLTPRRPPTFHERDPPAVPAAGRRPLARRRPARPCPGVDRARATTWPSRPGPRRWRRTRG